MQTNFSLLFYLKKQTKNSISGLIYVRITVDGIRSEFSGGDFCVDKTYMCMQPMEHKNTYN